MARFSLLGLILLAVAGCATSLRMHEVAYCDSMTRECALNSPDGIVVNKRATYRASVDATGLPGGGKNDKSFTGVDDASLLVVNVCRQPFASGKLDLTLTGTQLIKKISITGEPGAERALSAATEAVAARKAFEAKKESDKSGGGTQ